MNKRVRYRRASTTGTKRLDAYAGREPLFGDIHNHCGISYGHGSLEEALENAAERLDFCSVTGHAFWPDMPETTERNEHIIAFHKEGFGRLRDAWPQALATFAEHHSDGEFVTFPGFEMHSDEYGDHTIMYKDHSAEILYSEGLPDLKRRLAELEQKGVHAIAFPHHIGYKRGQRGINWSAFTPEYSPVVEIISMHGCSERDEAPRPFLHTMGPSDHESTMVYGLEQGNVFGVTGSTDHHSAHPGSYGHGITGVWADSLSRDAIWEAIQQRRTWALTGDRIALAFSVNASPMGDIVDATAAREIAVSVKGGGPIDYIDVIKNGKLLARLSEHDVETPAPDDADVHTLVYLELGWGPRGSRYDWDVELGIDRGEILSVDARFRGLEVVSPLEGDPNSVDGFHFSHWEAVDERTVQFETSTFGNPNNSTNTSQGVCLEVKMPRDGSVRGKVNDMEIDVPIARLIEGARVARMGPIPATSYLLHRAPVPSEFIWSAQVRDEGSAVSHSDADWYYVRVRQQNDQWAWSSPIFVR
jgi:hypothetical protein